MPRIDAFDLEEGDSLGNRYEVLAPLGTGLEGEVYLVRERPTRIERAAKLFYPQRNPRDRAARRYARKLHKLHLCPVVIQYHTWDTVEVHDIQVTILISEYVEGSILSDFLKRQPGGRLSPFQAVHLLHALACGVESIHQLGEYHGDLHTDNVIVQRHGLGFELKVLDLYPWHGSTSQNQQEDLFDLVRIFYDALGGQRHYARQPTQVKEIVRGLKRGLILDRFRRVSGLRAHLENLQWS